MTLYIHWPNEKGKKRKSNNDHEEYAKQKFINISTPAISFFPKIKDTRKAPVKREMKFKHQIQNKTKKLKSQIMSTNMISNEKEKSDQSKTCISTQLEL